MVGTLRDRARERQLVLRAHVDAGREEGREGTDDDLFVLAEELGQGRLMPAVMEYLVEERLAANRWRYVRPDADRELLRVGVGDVPGSGELKVDLGTLEDLDIEDADPHRTSRHHERSQSSEQNPDAVRQRRIGPSHQPQLTGGL